MNLQQLRYVITVAKYGTFREAARQLYMAQSSLSSSIKDLEEEYGIQIFERSKKGIEITKEGAMLLEFADQIVAQADQLDYRYLSATENRRLFSVSSQHYDFASEGFARLVSEKKEESLNFRFLETSTSKVMEDVRDAVSEVGFIYLNDFNGKVIKQYLEAFDLKFDPHVFLSESHPLAKQAKISQEDLHPYPVISFDQSKNSTLQLMEESIQVDQNAQRISASDRATVLNLLSVTNGYLVGSGLLKSNTQDHIVVVPMDVDQKNTIGFIYSKVRPLSKISKRYMEIVRELLEGDQRIELTDHVD
jgi:DNA-binding transcriptional LysR family regulator